MPDTNTVPDALDAGATASPSRHQILRMRQDTRRRHIAVSAVERISPRMARITFTSAELCDFSSLAPDDHIKLFFAPPTGDGLNEPAKRDYTPRRFDTAAGTLVIDFALHDSGPATAWANGAQPGDVLEIGGPRGSAIVPDDFDWYLLIGDETALPAIGRRVEELRAGVSVTTVVVVQDMAEAQHFATAANWSPHWVERRTEGPDDAASLRRALAGLKLAPGDGFVWIAAEAEVARTLRRHMLEDRGHPPAWLKAAGYWAQGRGGAHENLDRPTS